MQKLSTLKLFSTHIWILYHSSIRRPCKWSCEYL